MLLKQLDIHKGKKRSMILTSYSIQIGIIDKMVKCLGENKAENIFDLDECKDFVSDKADKTQKSLNCFKN